MTERSSIRVGNIDGFLARAALPGGKAEMITSAMVTADDSRFYLWLNALEPILLAPAGIAGDGLTRFLALIHADNEAEIFTDYHPTVTGRAVGNITAGEQVAVAQVRDITRYEIPDVNVRPGDKAVCVIKSGWRFGLFFDFTGKIKDSDHLWSLLGELSNILHLRRDLQALQDAADLESRPYVMTEGKTDEMHIAAARKRVAPALDLGFYTPDDHMRGNDRLLQACEFMAYGGRPNDNKIIAVFDSDVEKVVRKLRSMNSNSARFQSWGNNVFSLILPTPQHRPPDAGICIEDLYIDADLAKSDDQGRRLYFEDELERRPAADGNGPIYVTRSTNQPIPRHRQLARARAERTVNEAGEQVAISKGRFAELVRDGRGQFSEMDFSGFTELFDIIEEIIDIH
ncbi:hypothetical protein ABZ783_35950 [Micromonospora sp. NPDC047738]|uniref:hypothetical protein n=1 Tax=Micromonospora sp. NPDC047738 TaxID=3155741 RepID=UPI0033CA8745